MGILGRKRAAVAAVGLAALATASVANAAVMQQRPATSYQANGTVRKIIIVGNTRGSPYDPAAKPIEGHHPWRVVGKIGIDATVKSRHDPTDFERAWPRNWGKVKLEDYL